MSRTEAADVAALRHRNHDKQQKQKVGDVPQAIIRGLVYWAVV